MLNAIISCVYSLRDYIGQLEDELRLEYSRTMNRIRFDDEVLRHPEEFSHITVPTKEPEYVPQKGNTVSLVFIDLEAWSHLRCHRPVSCIQPYLFVFFLIFAQVVFPFRTFRLRRTAPLLPYAPCSDSQRCTPFCAKYGWSATKCPA